MAVDANVLIYERMREEQRHGRSAAMAIDAGFIAGHGDHHRQPLNAILAALILFNFGGAR